MSSPINNIFDMGRPLLAADDNKDIETRIPLLQSHKRTSAPPRNEIRRRVRLPACAGTILLLVNSLHEALSEYHPAPQHRRANTSFDGFAVSNLRDWASYPDCRSRRNRWAWDTEGNSALVDLGLGSSDVPVSLIRFEMRITLTGGGGTVSAPVHT